MAYATIAQLRAYLPQVPELGQQVITVTGSPAGGTFTLTYEGTATAALNHNATATAVQTALRAIPAIGSSGVSVRGRPGGPWVATFQGANNLAQDAGPLALGTNSLTGGSSPSVTTEPATDDLLQDCLDRATGIVRDALRALLGDDTFDYAAYGVTSTKILTSAPDYYFTIPPHQAGSVTLVEYQSASNPAAYATIPDQFLEESGRLYRASGWGVARYRVTAIWGYGPTPPDSIEQLTLELAVNIWRSRDKGGFTELVGVEGSGGIRQVAGLNKQQQLVIGSIVNQLIQVGV